MWTQADTNVWRRSDGWMVYMDRAGRWLANDPNSGVVFASDGEAREFDNADEGKAFVDQRKPITHD